MTRVIAQNDRRAFVRQKLPEVYQERQDRAAEGLRGFILGGLEKSGELHNDTGAMGEGLYIKSSRGSDYSERKQAAKAAYVGADSKWRDLVRMMVSPDAYSAQHFAERVADEEGFDAAADEIVTMLACMMIYGYWFQYGHENRFTGRWEQRSWFIEPLGQWANAQMHKYFTNIEADLK